MNIKSLCLAVLLALGLTPNTQTYSFVYSYKNIAIAACATIAGVAITKIAYDHFFQLTDAQEFEQAIKLCNQSEALVDKMSETMDIEKSHPCNQLVILITDIGQRNHVKYPFYNYAYNIHLKINTLIEYEDRITSKKIHIFERKTKLSFAITNISEQETLTIKSAIEAYDFVLEELKINLHKVQALRIKLQKIKSYIIAQPQYIIEEQRKRIEELEKEVYYHQCPRYHTAPLWVHPQTTNHIYVHNTSITTPTHISQAGSQPTSEQELDVPTQNNAKTAPSTAGKTSDIIAETAAPKAELLLENDSWRDAFYDAGNTFN